MEAGSLKLDVHCASVYETCSQSSSVVLLLVM